MRITGKYHSITFPAGDSLTEFFLDYPCRFQYDEKTFEVFPHDRLFDAGGRKSGHLPVGCRMA
jgi:hypothetical protein